MPAPRARHLYVGSQGLTETDDDMRHESETLPNYFDLLEQPGAFYAAVQDTVKRKLLAAYFSCIWIDDDGHETPLRLSSGQWWPKSRNPHGEAL